MKFKLKVWLCYFCSEDCLSASEFRSKKIIKTNLEHPTCEYLFIGDDERRKIEFQILDTLFKYFKSI